MQKVYTIDNNLINDFINVFNSLKIQFTSIRRTAPHTMDYGKEFTTVFFATNRAEYLKAVAEKWEEYKLNQETEKAQFHTAKMWNQLNAA